MTTGQEPGDIPNVTPPPWWNGEGSGEPDPAQDGAPQSPLVGMALEATTNAFHPPCKSCGKPTDGEASITLAGRTDFYCHRGFGETCYMGAQVLLTAACASVGIEHGKSTAQMLREIGAL